MGLRAFSSGKVVWICAGNRGHPTGIFLLLLSRVWGCDNSLGSFSSTQPSLGKNLLLISNLTLPDTTGNTLQIPSPGQLYFLCKKKKKKIETRNLIFTESISSCSLRLQKAKQTGILCKCGH